MGSKTSSARTLSIDNTLGSPKYNVCAIRYEKSAMFHWDSATVQTSSWGFGVLLA